jgi:hypothetical protein
MLLFMNNVITNASKAIRRRNEWVVQSVVIELIRVNGMCNGVAF